MPTVARPRIVRRTVAGIAPGAKIRAEPRRWSPLDLLIAASAAPPRPSLLRSVQAAGVVRLEDALVDVLGLGQRQDPERDLLGRLRGGWDL
jgi:hypothetical protein